jgi:hypothetical protein
MERESARKTESAIQSELKRARNSAKEREIDRRSRGKK